jgi:hypothetical protein
LIKIPPDEIIFQPTSTMRTSSLWAVKQTTGKNAE